MNPLVSVIIPSYNRCQQLKEAIESVLAQDFEDSELIVVDDGSTDNTPKLLADYGEKLMAIRRNNGGVSAARNTGIVAASGELIAFLDSDDLWLPKKLSVQTEFFRQHPDALICQTEEIWIRNGIRVNPKRKHKKPSGMIFEPSLALCLVSPSAVMIRKRLFDKVGIFDENLPACEDYDLWLRIAHHYPIYLIDTPLIIKRGGHDDQLSRNPGLDKYRIFAIRKLLDKHCLNDAQHEAAVKMLKEKCRIYAIGCRKHGREDEAAYYETLYELRS